MGTNKNIKDNLVGQRFGHWTVREELGGGKVLCECDCENHTTRSLYKSAVKRGLTLSCGCANKIGDIVGKNFGLWHVLEDVGNSQVLCECSCENRTRRILYKSALVRGRTLSCGCARQKNYENTVNKRDDFEDGRQKSKYIGSVVNGWTIIDRVRNGDKFVCQDSDGNVREFYVSHVIRGNIAYPNYSRLNSLEGKKFGNWTVIEELHNGKIKCQCNCVNKTIKIVYKSSLLNGRSKSCGCMRKDNCRKTMLELYDDICTLKINNPRTPWQIDTLNSKENFIKYIKSLPDKPTVYKLMNDLAVNKSTVLRTIHEYNCEDNIMFLYGDSSMAQDLANFIESLGLHIVRNDRDVISPYELDIYIPEKKIAIEFNGSYWHSEIFKDKYYHQLKTLACLKEGVHLIHIFEYEWENQNRKVLQLIKNILQKNNIVYARDCTIGLISAQDANEFLAKNHYQGKLNSSINIGLHYNNTLVEVMTLGSPRFDKNVEYELLRLCSSNGLNVVGGASRLLNYFIHIYNPKSIISYCDITKFSGKVYTKLGFKLEDITPPSYVWCDNHNNVLSRYETQKHKLVELGFDNSLTEDYIMHELNYVKIYNSGNAKYIWNRE